jgi:hypothetical protein
MTPENYQLLSTPSWLLHNVPCWTTGCNGQSLGYLATVQVYNIDFAHTCNNASAYALHLMKPKIVLINTPMTTANCLLLLHTPSSLNPQTSAPSGQKNPVMYPHSISSNPPSSTANPAPQPVSPPSPVNAGEGSVAVLSSHRSSRMRISAGEGIVSGVCVNERLVWKCERSDATSWAVKPELRRRSKPWA